MITHSSSTAILTKSQQVLQLLGSIHKKTVLVLIDSGCSTNFVSTALVHKMNLPTVPSPRHFDVELADGSLSHCTTLVPKLSIRIQKYRDKIDFDIMPLSRYDMILGQPWLYEYDPLISFRNHSLQFVQNGNLVELSGIRDQTQVPSISALQAK